MIKNELQEQYMGMYSEIRSIWAFYDILIAVLKYNQECARPVDILPVANIIDEKISNLCNNSDYFLWELHDRNII